MNNEYRGYYRAREKDEEGMNEGGSAFFSVQSGETVGSTHKRQSLYSQVCQLGFSPYNFAIFNPERREKNHYQYSLSGKDEELHFILYINIFSFL